jgi:uncharacterized membrane protein
VLDAIWCFPLLVGVVSWARQDWIMSGLFVGLAAGIKQIVWPILPFLLVWVIKTSDGWREFARRAGVLNGFGAAGFFFVSQNAVFLYWDPSAWWSSVMTPLGAGGASLESVGLGLAVIQQTTAASVSPTVWTLLVVGTFVSLLAGYWFFFDYQQTRWTAWILPMGIWVVHSRSLSSYFSFLSVIAVVVIAAGAGRLHGQEVAKPCAE